MLEQLTGHEDPHPIYERLRAHGPLTRDNGMWVTTSHPLINKILRDRRFGVRYADGTYPANGSLLPESFLELDPPDHTRLRRIATPAFSPKKIDEYRTRVEKVAESLLDSDEFDLITDFAAPLPISVISDLLGIPDADTAEFADYGALVAASFDSGVTAEMASANDKVLELLDRLIAQRRRTPGDDVISSLVAAEAEQRLTAQEMLGTLVLLLVAGFETTVNLIGNGTRALLDHPSQWKLFKANPELASAVVEETLRWAPPVQLTSRIAHEQVDGIGAERDGDAADRRREPRSGGLPGGPQVRRDARAQAGAPRVLQRHPLLPGRDARPHGGRGGVPRAGPPDARTCGRRGRSSSATRW